MLNFTSASCKSGCGGSCQPISTFVRFIALLHPTRSIAADAGPGDRHNMIFSSTAATYGHGRAVVTATGMQTQMGRIADLLKETPDETTPLQKELDRVGRLLAIIVVIIAVVMIATIILVEHVRGFSAIFEVLILGVALAVAAVPEGLPAMVTAVLSLGLQRMAKRNAIIRHLAAVETLGSTNVIAADKTGTLTKNEMTVRVVVTASGRVTLTGTGYSPKGDLRRDGGETIDGAPVVTDTASPGVLRLSCGAWYDPLGSDDNPLCVHGNANVLTADHGGSKLSQGPSCASTLVEIERLSGQAPPVRVFVPPPIDSTATA